MRLVIYFESSLNFLQTEKNLYLLVTFHNLSAPFTVDCEGAYIEVGLSPQIIENLRSLTLGPLWKDIIQPNPKQRTSSHPKQSYKS